MIKFADLNYDHMPLSSGATLQIELVLGWKSQTSAIEQLIP